MNIDFYGKKVFITGASRGIGKRIKTIFEENGAVTITPSRDNLDLSSSQSIHNYISKNSNMEIDIFIHCAGLNRLAGIEEIDDEILQEVLQINTLSSITLIKHVIPYMKQKGEGRIVFISSLYAIITKERRIAYSTSKCAITGLMKTLTVELGKDNILVNAVAPGYVMTEMTERNLSKEEINNIETKIPCKRFQTEDDIANLVCFLCSNLNQNISGQIIAVDGGFTCR